MLRYNVRESLGVSQCPCPIPVWKCCWLLLHILSFHACLGHYNLLHVSFSPGSFFKVHTGITGI